MKYLKKITVDTATSSYPVFVGTDILKSLPKLTEEFNLPGRVFIIIDKKVDNLFGRLIKKVISSFSSKRPVAPSCVLAAVLVVYLGK